MKKFIMVAILLVALSQYINPVFAIGPDQRNFINLMEDQLLRNTPAGGVYSLTDIWSQALDFFNDGKSTDANSNGISITDALEPAKKMISDILFVIGNAIFFVSTMVLGVKYMFLSGSERASIKESLMTLVVAAIFFYAAGALTSFGTDIANNLVIESGSYEQAIGKMVRTVSTIAQMLAFAATIILGMKYMMASASEKAQMKMKMFPFVIGIGFIFATSLVLKYIAGIANTLFTV